MIRRRTLTESDYRALSEFRYHLLGYLNFSDQAARTAGLEPRQYQLLLAIRGLDEDTRPTIGVLAERLHIRHHSAVELVNRAEANGLVRRNRQGSYVELDLTAKGSRVLTRAVQKRLKQLEVAGPILVRTLQQLIRTGAGSRRKKR